MLAGMDRVLAAYTTVLPDEVGTSLFEDRKSQFFGFAAHAESADEAIEFRHGIMGKIPTASHYVSAWVLSDGAEFYSDAKEPHGTAGLPVLNVIKGAQLADTVCVVARVFGGTLLGKGGLMRAYTKAATEAIADAPCGMRLPCQLVTVTLPYALYEPLTKRLADWGAIIDDTEFADQVTLHLDVPRDQADALAERIRDFTNATATCILGPEELRYRMQTPTSQTM